MDSNENSRLSRVAKRREEESRNNPRKPNKNSGLVKKIILGALTALLALFVIGATVFMLKMPLSFQKTNLQVPVIPLSTTLMVIR